MIDFQTTIFKLSQFWAQQGCAIVQPLDMEIGAGTFHPATFLRAVGPEYWQSAYVQPCRRPSDGRYGKNPNRLQRYYQFQVMLKPVPDNFLELYFKSLASLGIDSKNNDLRLVEDDWESPTLGAWGLGWEVWLNGMEVTQITYFQQAGGLECNPACGELTYGLERLAMALQQVDSVYDLLWSEHSKLKYGDIYQQNEDESSHYNFKHADTREMTKQFLACEKACGELVSKKLPLPAYEQTIRASHLFNLLDARAAISATERNRYILRIRELASAVARCYLAKRLELGFPNAPRQLAQQTIAAHAAQQK